jgi:hypothetical protein
VNERKNGTDGFALGTAGLRNETMLGLMPPNDSGCKFRQRSAVAAASLFGIIWVQTPALSEVDVFQQAVNYVFAGNTDPQDGPEIVDRKSCVIVLRDPKYNRYIRYYLNRFNMDEAIFGKKYAGPRPYYELDVKGDDVVIEYLNPDKKTVAQGYRSAQIPLPGDIDQAQKALRIIFADYCKAEKPKAPF